MNKCRLLFLAANPKDASQLALDEESREIEQKVRGSEFRDSLEQVTRWAVRPDDLLQLLNQYRPHIVHFSGHGSDTEEIFLQDSARQARPVSSQALRALFTTLKDNVRVVVLNACYSQAQALAITEVVDCAIGMSRKIGDRAARVFASAFYRAIAFGRSVQEAFDQGRAALLLEGIADDETPVLLVRAGVVAASIILIEDGAIDRRQPLEPAPHLAEQRPAPLPSRSTRDSVLDRPRPAPFRAGDRFQLDRFSLVEMLGETEYSSIHRCLYDGKTVVLKRTREELCDLDSVRELIRLAGDPFSGWTAEVRAAVAVPTAAWKQDGFMWEVQDFHAGVSLGALVVRHKRPVLGPFLRRLTQSLSETLIALSKEGLIHRDINPFNLLITTSGELRLIDWTFCSHPSRPSIPMVTEGYTAPEQRLGQSSPTSDWYSLAATLYFLVNGSAPPARDTSELKEGLSALFHTGGERLEYVVGEKWSVGLSDLCSRLLDPDPSLRPVPTRIGWIPITQEFPQPPFPMLSVFQLTPASHLLLAKNGWWILPRDLDLVVDRLAWEPTPNVEVEALLRRYRSP